MKLPKYPLPCALIGRLAVDERAQGRRLGEKLLIDALHRVVEAASMLGCIGVIVDAKEEGAEQFYAKYDFVTVDDASWPRRMLLPIGVARAALAEMPMRDSNGRRASLRDRATAGPKNRPSGRATEILLHVRGVRVSPGETF